jgi:hypothetical protein
MVGQWKGRSFHGSVDEHFGVDELCDMTDGGSYVQPFQHFFFFIDTLWNCVANS